MARHHSVIRLAILAALALSFAPPPQIARAQESTEVKRKLKVQVQPVYPELARRMNIHGKVRLEVTIGADGAVKNIHCLGGHPLLGGPAQDAVRGWKYEPGPKETSVIVEVNFE